MIERTQELAKSLERERIEAGRNQAILNSIADGVVVFDTKWNAILANPALRAMLELPTELIVNKNFRDLIEHPRLSPKSRHLLYAMMEHDTQPPSFRIEWEKKTLSISAAQVYDNSKDKHTNIGTVTVFRDFTREAEVEKLKSTFVAIVSHELRTPLNAILGYAEMFKEAVYGPMNDKQVNMAERIMKNTQRLLGPDQRPARPGANGGRETDHSDGSHSPGRIAGKSAQRDGSDCAGKRLAADQRNR